MPPPSERQRARADAGSRPKGRRIALGVAALLVVALAAWGFRAVRVVPPRLAESDASLADPEVVALIERSRLLVRLVPFAPGRWADLGMAFEANGMGESAATCYARALAGGGDDPRIRYRLAMVLAENGDPAAAIDEAARAIALAPEHAPLHWRRGFWRLELGRLDEAEADFDRAIELDADDRAPWFGRALVALRRGDAAAALAILERPELAGGPTAAYARHLRGTARARLGGDDDRARIELARGSRTAPPWRDPWSEVLRPLRRGMRARMDEVAALLAAGRAAAALELLEALAAAHPEDIAIANNRGVALMRLGRHEEAAAVLDASLAQAPDAYQTRLNLAAVHLGAGRRGAALEQVERAQALAPEISRVHEMRGMVLQALDRDPEAIRAFDEAVRLDAGNANALVQSGIARLNTGDRAGAIERLSLATHRAPGEILAWIGLGLGRLAAGDRAGATEALDVAALIDPADPRLAAARARLGTPGMEERP